MNIERKKEKIYEYIFKNPQQILANRIQQH